MRRTAADAALTRQAICEAAIGIFARDNWSQATFGNIAAAAGVTRGAVYHHFTDKTQLLIEATTQAWQRHTDQAVAHLANQDLEPGDRLTAFLDAYLTQLATNQGFRELAVVSALVAPQALNHTGTQPRPQQSPARETATSAKSDALGIWAELLRETLIAGHTEQIGLTPDLAVDLVLTFLNGVTVTAAIEPARLPGAADTAQVAKALARAVLPARAGSAR